MHLNLKSSSFIYGNIILWSLPSSLSLATPPDSWIQIGNLQIAPSMCHNFSVFDFMYVCHYFAVITITTFSTNLIQKRSVACFNVTFSGTYMMYPLCTAQVILLCHMCKMWFIVLKEIRTFLCFILIFIYILISVFYLFLDTLFSCQY